MLKEMKNQKKEFKQPWKGSHMVIALKLGCHPKYVSLVLRSKLGKYNDRDTELVRRIREINDELEKLTSPDE